MIFKLAPLLAAACIALPVAASAQSNPVAGKTACVIDGKTYYQNGSCPAGSQRGVVSNGAGQKELEELAKRKAENEKIEDAAWARRKAVCDAYGTKALHIGMKEEELQCLSTYTDPIKVNVTTTARGTRKQYVYDTNGGEYLYFENGVMTSMQGQQH